jgi:nucleoside-diphosphate-sugar epimerase
MMRQKKILVTGAGGFVGISLIKKIVRDKNYSVRAYVRDEISFKQKIEKDEKLSCENIEVFEGSLRIGHDVEQAIKGVDIIVHCAAKKGGHVATMYHDTVVGTRNLLQAIIDGGNKIERFVHISSFSVYDTFNLKKNTLINETIRIENGFSEKKENYKYVKVKQEEVIRYYMAKFGVKAVILRPGVIYGPGSDPISRRVGFDLFGLFVFVGGDNLMPLSYIDNCIDAIILACENDNAVNEVFNVHDTQLATCREFLKLYTEYFINIRYISVHYQIMKILSLLYEKYVEISKESLPPVFSRFKTVSTWKPMRFDNKKIVKMLCFKQNVPTADGLHRHFSALKAR